MKTKYDPVEGERNVLVDNEIKLEDKVRQLTSQLEAERLAAANAIEQLEQEQCAKRELQEELNDIKVTRKLFNWLLMVVTIVNSYTYSVSCCCIVHAFYKKLWKD